MPDLTADEKERIMESLRTVDEIAVLLRGPNGDNGISGRLRRVERHSSKMSKVLTGINFLLSGKGDRPGLVDDVEKLKEKPAKDRKTWIPVLIALVALIVSITDKIPWP